MQEQENASFEDKLTQESKQQIQEQTMALGSLLHDEWRAPRKQEDRTYEPRVKTTKDEAWVKAHGTDQVDIANNTYAELPQDWQGENKASAEVAVSEAWKAKLDGKELDEAFVEQASSVIHEKWLERNGEWAPEEQKKPYAELSEEEKEKDRVIVRKAIEIVNPKQSTDNKFDYHNSTYIGNSMLKKDRSNETPPPGVNPKDWDPSRRPLTKDERRYGAFGPDETTKK